MGRNSNFYDNADSRTYRFPAATLSAAAVVGRIAGPAGKIGRVRGIEYVITTNVTVTPAVVTVGNNGAVNPATLDVPVAAANSIGAQTDAQLKVNGADAAGAELAADTVVEVASDGGPTAGAADLVVQVDWF